MKKALKYSALSALSSTPEFTREFDNELSTIGEKEILLKNFSNSPRNRPPGAKNLKRKMKIKGIGTQIKFIKIGFPIGFLTIN